MERREKLLSGDQAAIAGWAKRAAKWPASKRKRIAEKLLKKFQELKAKGDKKRFGKEREDTKGYQAKFNEYKLKLAALYRLEAQARKAPKKPIVPDDPETTPIYADTQMDTPDLAEDTDFPVVAVAVTAGLVGLVTWLLTAEPSEKEKK